MKKVHLGQEGFHVWDNIWRLDRYSEREEREARALRRILSFGLQPADFTESSHVLDIGCGSGDNLSILRKLTPADANLVGIDFSRNALRKAHELLHGQAALCRGSALQLPFQENFFSHVFAFGVLEHITDSEKALREILRVTKPRGRIYITTSNNLSLLQLINAFLVWASKYAYGYQRNWDRRTFNSFLSQAAHLQRSFVLQSDCDMPIVRAWDTALKRLGWGRYLFAELVKC